MKPSMHRFLHQLFNNSARRRLMITGWFSQALQSLVASLVEPSEPQVWQTRDRHGNVLWNAYDPTTGHTVQDLSEPEIRAWIERRHYRAA